MKDLLSMLLCPTIRLLLAVTLLCGQPAGIHAATAETASPTAETTPSYHLAAGDRVRITLFGEPELGVEESLDDLGRIRLPLHGPLVLNGLTTREAEAAIEKAYVDARLLRSPQASLVITAFRPRAALAIGQLRKVGSIEFPPATERVDIVDFVTLAGGFTETARTGSVQVIRTLPDGTSETHTLDVGARILRTGDAETTSSFWVLPGDRIVVSQRIF